MKHSLFKIIAPVIFAAGFSACGIADISMPPEPKLTGGFSCECTVSASIVPPGNDSAEETVFVFSGVLSRLGTGFYELELSSPETVSGMKISSHDGDISSSLGELSLDISSENIPQKSPVFALFTSFDNLAAAFEKGGELVSGEDGGWVYQCDGLSAVFDGNGYITSMAMPSPKMTAEFSDFTVAENISQTAPSEISSEVPSETTSSEAATVSETSDAITVSVTAETTPPVSTVPVTSESSETVSVSDTESTLISETTAPVITME